jgi:hypothetical protein
MIYCGDSYYSESTIEQIKINLLVWNQSDLIPFSNNFKKLEDVKSSEQSSNGDKKELPINQLNDIKKIKSDKSMELTAIIVNKIKISTIIDKSIKIYVC